MPSPAAEAGGSGPPHRPQPVGPSRWILPEPNPGDAEVVGVGADLEPATLVDAYARGIFPWPQAGSRLPWCSPDPRAVIEPGRVHASRTLRRHLRRCGWTSTVDLAFAEVVAGCSRRREGTWITRPMRRAYTRLADLGWAHSVEVWDGEELVGGIYGVAIGGCFTGESMFHRAPEASKVALVDLCHRWFAASGAVVDVQLPTPHLQAMGAVTVSRVEFLRRLAAVRHHEVALDRARWAVSRLAAVG